MKLEARLNEYKTLRLALTDSLNKNGLTDNLISQFNTHFESSKLHLCRSENGHVVNLREVSMSHLDTVIESLRDGTNDADEILDAIKQTIDSVRSFGLRGETRLYVGYNKERKVSNRKNKETQRGKHYYTGGKEFNSNNIQIPVELVNQIICGDSEKVLKKLPDNCIDLVFTSPPYNFGLEYDDQNDASKWDNYFDKLFKILDECIRVLKYGGRLVINIQPLFSDYIPSHHIISKGLMDRGLLWKGEVLWVECIRFDSHVFSLNSIRCLKHLIELVLIGLNVVHIQ